MPRTSPYRLEPPIPAGGWPTLLRPPITQAPIWWYGNINPFPITYASRPRLRGRLTLSGLTFLRKPRVFGEQGFHLFYRYSCRHDLFRSVHHSFRNSFTRNGMLPYRPRAGHARLVHGQPGRTSLTCPTRRTRSFGTELESRSLSARNHLTSELLRTL